MTDDMQTLSIEVPVTITPDDQPIDMDDNEENQAIVIDNGSSTIKAGFAGDDAPLHVFPTTLKPNTNGSDYYIGQEAIESNNTTHPIRSGVIINWDHITKIWHHTFNKRLKINPSEHAVLHTEIPLNPKANREKATQIMFETFNIPAYYVGIQEVLSLYASGRTTGIVLGTGYQKTCIVPIYEGYATPHAILRQDLGGKDMTSYLKKLLFKNKNYSNWNINFDEFRKIKEQFAYIAENGTINELSKQISDNPSCIISGYLRRIYSNYSGKTAVDIENICNKYFGESRKYIRCKYKYKLPDGKIVEISDEAFKCGEIFFEPKLIGKSDMEGIGTILYNSIMKLSVSIRRDMYYNVVLSGGTSLLCGFAERVQTSVSKFAPSSIKVKMIAPPERKYSVWIGGSIVSSLSTFQEMWISKDEYDESGPGIVHRKCF